MKKNRKVNLLFLCRKILICMPILLISCSGANDSPLPAGIGFSPLIQGGPVFCESGSVGQMCAANKGLLGVNVFGSGNFGFNTNNYSAHAKYCYASTVSNGGTQLAPITVNGVLQSYEHMNIGTISTNDQLLISVPFKRKYRIECRYVQFGSSNPVSTNALCANPYNSQCYTSEKYLTFQKRAYPNSSSNVIDFNSSSLGTTNSCGL